MGNAEYMGSLMDMRRAGTTVRAAVDMFQLAYWHRRLENCNFTDGKDLGDGLIDAQGWDYNQAKDTLNSQPLGGLPLFYTIDLDGTKPPGWDPEMSNEYDGPSAYAFVD